MKEHTVYINLVEDKVYCLPEVRREAYRYIDSKAHHVWYKVTPCTAAVGIHTRENVLRLQDKETLGL